MNNPSKIAAAQDENGIPSDNRIALELADFRNKIIEIDGRNCTIDDTMVPLYQKSGWIHRRLPGQLTAKLSW